MLIDDNFLSDQSIKDIQERVLIHNRDINWVLAFNTNLQEDDHVTSNQSVLESYQFVAGLMPNTTPYHYFWNIFRSFAVKHEIEYTRIIRMKLNWLPQSPHASSESYHLPHVDSDESHKVFLYYLNDSDGDTFFFNETYPLFKDSELTLNKRVSPKAGRGVVFDGLTYHASSSPKNSEYRCILNIDFI